MNVKLLVVQGKPQGKEIPLRTPKFLIGRGTECHLRPNSELVSRHHSLLTLEDDVVRLRDLGSTNGTLLNGQRIDGEVVVRAGDMIQVGPLGFKLIIEAVPAAAASQPEAPVVRGGRPVPRSAAAASVGKLGSKEAGESAIEQWLLSDSKHQVPTSGQQIDTGDTQMELKTTVDEAIERDTKTDLTLPPQAESPAEPEEKIVEAEGGAKIKIKGAKLKIEKTREDTSRAAADIIRRLMQRRPDR